MGLKIGIPFSRWVPPSLGAGLRGKDNIIPINPILPISAMNSRPAPSLGAGYPESQPEGFRLSGDAHQPKRPKIRFSRIIR